MRTRKQERSAVGTATIKPIRNAFWIGVANVDGLLLQLAQDPASEREDLVEALLLGPPGSVPPEVPFPEDPRGVTRVAEMLGERDLFGVHGVAVLHDSRPRVEAPREEGCARGRADRRDVEGGEHHAGLRHRVEAGRTHRVVAGEAEVSVTLVVGQDQDDVGAGVVAVS